MLRSISDELLGSFHVVVDVFRAGLTDVHTTFGARIAVPEELTLKSSQWLEAKIAASANMNLRLSLRVHV